MEKSPARLPARLYIFFIGGVLALLFADLLFLSGVPKTLLGAVIWFGALVAFTIVGVMGVVYPLFYRDTTPLPQPEQDSWELEEGHYFDFMPYSIGALN